VECDWNAYDTVITAITKLPKNQQQQAARTQGFAARASLVTNVTTMMWDLMDSISTIEGSGTTMNLISHSLLNAVGDVPTAQLESLAGEALPANCQLPMDYDPTRAPRLRVQTVRSMLAPVRP
jgi:hypothetical protein